MGDFDVVLCQKTLKELIASSKLGLIIEKKPQLQSLEEDIKFLMGFLKAMEMKRNHYPELMKLVMQIKDLVSEVENIVELFIVHTFKADHASNSLHEHHNHLPIKNQRNNRKHHKPLSQKNNRKHHKPLSLDIASVKKGIKTLTIEVKKIYDKIMCDIKGVTMCDIKGATFKQLEHSSIGSEGIGSSRGSQTSQVVKEEVVLGFGEEVQRLIEKLDNGGTGRSLEIISIIGAGGGGKTTLAREVYDHPFTLYTFEIRAWINVSQDYDKTRKRNLLIRFLESVIPRNYENNSDDVLGEHIFNFLKGRKFLIVMDDIWGIEPWNDIQRSFPKECMGSKVLFTSRLVVQPDSVGYIPHYLAHLPKNCSWELLQKKVFGMKCCPPELVDIGEQIAEKCKGLPLAIVTIAGILAAKDKTLDVWEEVAKNLSLIIGKNQGDFMEILELSYNNLPLHLKACLLYIGGYPEDIEIPVRELIWLWVAEGFIQRSEGGESLETIAKDYLTSLIDRSLIMVARKSPLGRIKACRIHDLLREFCLKKAEDDKFFVKLYQDDSFSPSATKKHRRLFSSHQFLEKYFSLRPGNLRSFLCIGSLNKHQSWVKTKLSFFGENFEHLRVLSFISHTCDGEIGIGPLVHLRYLAFTFDRYGLPFSYLLNLETLNLISSFSNGTIGLPHYILKMVKLRHLYTKNGVFTFHFSEEEEAGRNSFNLSSTLDSLQTLHRICACEACRSFLVRTPNLRKLGLYGEDNKVLRLLDLEFLKCLETLTFTSVWSSYSSVDNTLLPGLKLPLTITRITFKSTFFKWEELSLLQTLPSLEALKLINYACVGPVWNISELEGFPRLKYLRFCCLNIKEWNASEDQFPKLEVLVLQGCRELKHIPIDFCNLNELREIKLERCRRSAEESAMEIQEEQRNRRGDDCLNLLTKDNTD